MTMRKKDESKCIELCSFSRRFRDRIYIDNTRKLQNHRKRFYCLRCKDVTMRPVTGEIKFRDC
jgi:hypothetical protein